MFDDLYLVATKNTPDISLQSNGHFSFIGRSYPENTYEFYHPILNWLNRYFKHKEMPVDVVIDFEISYFNSSSSKVFFDILSLLNENVDKFSIHIRWIYDPDNDNALEAGEEFIEEFPGLDIALIESLQ
jgi:hypothetical protein